MTVLRSVTRHARDLFIKSISIFYSLVGVEFPVVSTMIWICHGKNFLQILACSSRYELIK